MSISAFNNNLTVSNTAVDVQIKASHGITGAANKPVIASIARCEAVVCVTPTNEYAVLLARNRNFAATSSPGPGKYNAPISLSKSN